MMMYQDDIDADHVKSTMKISDSQLEIFVNNLLKRGLLKYSSNDEVEITKEGIYYITRKEIEYL